jgi:hypothetical protein
VGQITWWIRTWLWNTGLRKNEDEICEAVFELFLIARGIFLESEHRVAAEGQHSPAPAPVGSGTGWLIKKKDL